MNGGRDTPHWRAYDRARISIPDLLHEMADMIRIYAVNRDSFTSQLAGNSILRRWDRSDEWNRCFGDLARPVFGIVLYETLSGDFSLEEERVGTQTRKALSEKMTIPRVLSLDSARLRPHVASSKARSQATAFIRAPDPNQADSKRRLALS